MLNEFENKKNELEENRGKTVLSKDTTLCEMLQLKRALSGDKELTFEEKKRLSSCPKPMRYQEVDLIASLKKMRTAEWVKASESFKNAQKEYQELYATKEIWMDRVDDEKIDRENVLKAWQRASSNAMDDIVLEIGGLQHKEKILIINNTLENFEEKAINYKPKPLRFAVIYISRHNGPGQEVYLVHLGSVISCRLNLIGKFTTQPYLN